MNDPYNPVKSNVTAELAEVEVASRARAPKASFRPFDLLFVGGLAAGALIWGGYLAWSAWL